MVSISSRQFYIATLFGILLYSLLTSLLYVLEEPTTIEQSSDYEHVAMPSITYCGRQWTPDNFETFEDVMQAINNEKKVGRNYASLRNHGKGIPVLKVWLNDTSDIRKMIKNEPLDLDEIWTYSATIQPDKSNAIIICTTLNLYFLNTPPPSGSIQLKLEMKHNTSKILPGIIAPGFYVEKHEYKQSLHNYDFDRLKNFQIFHVGKGLTELSLPIETKRLNKLNHDCFEDNSMKMTDCINNFIEHKLNCSLPWNKPKSQICSGAKKLQEFRNLSLYISSSLDLVNEIKARNCFKPNCVTTKWKPLYHESYDISKAKPNFSNIQMGILHTSYTIKEREILLADFSTFLTDCGAYLGLYLGASVLSITDILISQIKRFINWIKK